MNAPRNTGTPALAARSFLGEGRKPPIELVVLFASLLCVIGFALTVDSFATIGNLENLARNSAPLMILSCGMGIVVIGRGLDLSQIAVMTSVASIFGVLLLGGYSAPVAFGAAFCAAIALGLINGWLVAYAEIPSLLATLATAILFTGFTRWTVLQGEFLLLLPKDHPLIAFMSGGRIAGIPFSVATAMVVAGLTWFFLSNAAFGHSVRASGDNFATARLGGLPTRLITIVVFIFAALTATIAGLLIASTSGTVDYRIVSNGTLLFEVIMVVVLGGISLRGGRGSLLSIVAGVLLISVLRNGMTLMDLSTQVQSLAKGLILIAAIVIDNYFNPRDPETDTVGDL